MGKRCAILTAFDPYTFRGGIETYTRQIVNLLQSQGIAVDIYHTSHIPGTGKAQASSAVLHSRFLNELYPVGSSFFQVDHLYDFVIAHAFFGFGYFPPRIPAFTIFHSTHVQYAEDNRELFASAWYFEVRSLFGFGAERLSTIGKKVIAVSDAVASEVTKHYEAQAVSTVLTGVDRTIFFPRANKVELREKFNIPAAAFVGVFLARWDLDKGIDTLESIIAATPHVFWLFVLGTGAYCTFRGKANIKIIENVDQEVVAEILSSADFLLHTSRYEGFGLAIVEALACGLPVITAPVGVARSICQEQPFCSLLLPSYTGGKKHVIAAAIETISRVQCDEDLRRTLREAGPVLIEQRFDHHQWETAFLSVLDLAAQ